MWIVDKVEAPPDTLSITGMNGQEYLKLLGWAGVENMECFGQKDFGSKRISPITFATERTPCLVALNDVTLEPSSLF